MTKKKILFAANLESFFTKFLIPQLKWFKENGYEVHVAAKSENLNIPYCDKKFNVDFARGFNIKQNINSYKQMKKIFKEEHYDIVSCHTPFGAAITRLAYKNSKVKNTKMVYMNHGFHFYKGASLLHWLLFYPAEKYLAKYTDTLITINLEDYEIAKKKFKTNVKYVKGIGLDASKFDFDMSDNEKLTLRESLGLKKDDYVLIYPAELLPRKRQVWLINTLSELFKNHSNFKLLLPGKDSMNGECQELVNKLELSNQIKFLGFRKDIPQLLNISNLAVSSSKQEGLPVNVMEAIYCGLPVVATDCRGNRDLIEDGKNGYIVDLNDNNEFCNKVLYFYELSNKEKDKIKKIDKTIIKDYLKDNVIESIVECTIGNKKSTYNGKETQHDEYKMLDIVKFIAIFLIVGSHSLPLFNNEILNYYYGQWFFRFCVPILFMSSGFFYSRMNNEKKKKYINRLIYIYIISTILYIPLFQNTTLLGFIYNIIFGYGHLWYLSAIIFALVIIYIFSKYIKFSNKKMIFSIIILLILGILFDEYYKIFNISLINRIASILEYIGGGRSFIFFALPLLLVGILISKNFEKIKQVLNINKKFLIFLIVSIIFSFFESMYLKYKLNQNITADLTFLNIIPALLIFIMSLFADNKKIKFNTKLLRKMSDIIYVIHILIINITARFVASYNNFLKFNIYYFISLIVAYFLIKCDNFLKKRKFKQNITKLIE